LTQPPRGPVAAATHGFFAALSRIRGSRIFHPEGLGYRGGLAVTAAHPEYPGVPLLARRAEYPVLCRLSRGGGLPERVPDVLGLAVRIADLHGPGRPQDFLLATGASAPVARHLLLPGIGGFFGQTLSSLLPYRVGNRMRIVGARGADAASHATHGSLEEVREAFDRGELRFQLALAGLRGDWSPFGELTFEAPLPGDETERMAFDPWNTGGGITPAGPLQKLRRPAYRGSQRGRGATAA
jgi:hypothetical protein